MKKEVKKIAEAVIEIADEFDVDEATALDILKTAAGSPYAVVKYLEGKLEDGCDEPEEYAPNALRDEDDEDDEDEDEDDEIFYQVSATTANVSKDKRVTINKSLLEEAEDIKGSLSNYGNRVTVLSCPSRDEVVIVFGETDDYPYEIDDSFFINTRTVRANGTVDVPVGRVFNPGEVVNVALEEDGYIIITH